MRIFDIQQRIYAEQKQRPFHQARFTEWVKTFLCLFGVSFATERQFFSGTPAQFRNSLDDLLLLAAECGVDMERAVWEKYPNLCPYCFGNPCGCGLQKLGPAIGVSFPFPKGGLALQEAQEMFDAIYPKRTSLEEEVWRLIEEVAEVSQALWKQDTKKEVAEEFADVFARFCRIANTLGIRLEGFAS